MADSLCETVFLRANTAPKMCTGCSGNCRRLRPPYCPRYRPRARMEVYQRLPRAEFKRLHSEHIHSDWWKNVFAPMVRRHFEWTCCVCGKRGWIVDHKRYRKDGRLIFGRETINDVRLVCDRCDRKGTRSDFAVSQSKIAQTYVTALDWLFDLTVRFAGWLIRVSAKMLSVSAKLAIVGFSWLFRSLLNLVSNTDDSKAVQSSHEWNK
ncbi:hypothetical protein Pan258_01710 [Symmachiella dynata]|nr:hypothetical protein Pan258_01710 [Symmachiella dynata]